MRSLFNAWSTPSLAKIFELITTASSPKTIRPCKKKKNRLQPQWRFLVFTRGPPWGQSLLGFSSRSRKRKGDSSLPEPRQTFEVAAARNFWTSKSCFSLIKVDFFTPRKQSILLSSSWSRRSRRSPNFWTSQSRFPSSNCFFECEPPFIDKPTVITEPAIPSARLLGLGSTLYPSNIQRMLSQYLARLMQSLSRVWQTQASERKALTAGHEDTLRGIKLWWSSWLTLYHHLHHRVPNKILPEILRQRTTNGVR